MSDDDPHRGGSVLAAGVPAAGAKAAMIMLHGRGANAADILSLAQVFEREEIAYLAPEAAGHTWYPRPFVSPREANEPNLSSALAVVGRLLTTLADDGVGAERVILLGFSQGACLALDFAARNPRRYGGVAALSGGLIGSEIRAEDFSGSLDATPVFIGCSDVDPHIPLRRVEESAAVCRALGAEVTARIYRGMGHTINEDEVAEVQKLIDRVAGAGG